MTDEHIIKALECCIAKENCEGISCEICPYDKVYDCKEEMLQNVLDLINRKKAEIESLKQIVYEDSKEIIELHRRIVFWQENLRSSKSEAIKEFAERLKKEIRLDDDCEYDCGNCYYECKEYVPVINNLVKEMTEEEK